MTDADQRASSNPILSIVFTVQDVEDIAYDLGADLDLAVDRALEWADAIRDTASSLVGEQLASVIETGQP